MHLLTGATSSTNANPPTAVTDGVDMKKFQGVNNLVFDAWARSQSGALTFMAKIWGWRPVKTKATGTIVCIAQASYVQDEKMAGISLTGDATEIQFLADLAGTGTDTATLINVDLSGASTAADCASALQDSIRGHFQSLIECSLSTATITLTSSVLGTNGNQTITEGVTDGSHTVSGFSGAIDGFWQPVGSGYADYSNAGKLNDGETITEVSDLADKLQHTEVMSSMSIFSRLYAQVLTAANGTFDLFVSKLPLER